MTQILKGEFWRGLEPIANVFKPDAKPEQYLQGIAIEDERFHVPFGENVRVRPLHIAPEKNRWCGLMTCKGPGLVNRHYHPHEVFAYTISGKWGYLEHDWVATAGDFVYEAPGSGHTLVVHDSEEPMRTLFVVHGPLIWLDEQGKTTGYFDVYDYLAMCRAHYDEVGLGREAVDRLIR